MSPVQTSRQNTKHATDSSYTQLGLLAPGHTVFRKISFTVSPGLFGVWLIVNLQLLPFPAQAIWAAAIKLSPPRLQTKAYSNALLTRTVNIPPRNEEQRGCKIREQGQKRSFQKAKKYNMVGPPPPRPQAKHKNCMLKEPRHKKPSIIRLHSYETSRRNKSTETESTLVVA